MQIRLFDHPVPVFIHADSVDFLGGGDGTIFVIFGGCLGEVPDGAVRLFSSLVLIVFYSFLLFYAYFTVY